MKWHDCKTDPPKKSGHYVVHNGHYWEEGLYYHSQREIWKNVFDKIITPIKWAEVNLSEDS